MRITAFNARYQKHDGTCPTSLLSCDGLKFDDVLHYIARTWRLWRRSTLEQTVQDRLQSGSATGAAPV
jgi:hypothetical protein